MLECDSSFIFFYFLAFIFLCFVTINLFLITNNNPFDEETSSDKEQYFNNSLFGNESKYLKKIITNFNLDDNKLLKYTKSYRLRNMMEERICIEIQKEIIINNKSLNEIFNLNIKPIHYISLGLLIIFGINFILFFFLFFTVFGKCCCPDKILYIKPFLNIINYIDLGLGILNLVLFIILLIFYFLGSGNEYNDFLHSCKINLKSFEKYENAESLKTYAFYLIEINIPYLILNFLKAIFGRKKKEPNDIILEAYENAKLN